MSQPRPPQPPRLSPSRTYERPVEPRMVSSPWAMDVTELLVMLRRNVRLVLSVTFAVVLLVAGVLRYEEPAYQSSAALRLADARIAVAGGFEQAQLEGET